MGDQLFDNFDGYKGFGPPFAQQAVPTPVIDEYRARLPDKLGGGLGSDRRILLEKQGLLG